MPLDAPVHGLAEAPDARRTASPVPVTVARGDGVGPEIMEATLRVLRAAGARIEVEEVEIGERVYCRGVTSGIEPSVWESLRRTRVFLKAPITTPQGKGFKSLNVTARKTLGLFANVRPCETYAPFIPTAFPGMDIVVIRENEEDTYGGIEHRQTPEVTQCLKLITRPGTERLIRYAFEYARRHGRKKVSCFTKDNIMKMTDGLFHRVFEEVAAEHPEIESEHRIIDIGAALLAQDPRRFDVVVLPNLYGDIISDICAQLAGSVGMAGSANIGEQCAMFEAVHGSAPDIAGAGVANPSGLLHAAILMLDHIGQPETAAMIDNAWRCAVEDEVRTADVCEPDRRAEAAGTIEFADAVIERLGRSPQRLPARMVDEAAGEAPLPAPPIRLPRPEKALVGVDVFLDWDEADRDPGALAARLESAADEVMRLRMITNRGVKVHPDGHPETFCTDHWRCRFVPAREGAVTHQQIVDLLQRLHNAGLDFIKTEHLYTFDGEPAFSLGQGE